MLAYEPRTVRADGAVCRFRWRVSDAVVQVSGDMFPKDEPSWKLWLLLLLGLAMTGAAAEQLPDYLLPCANSTKLYRCPNDPDRDRRQRCLLYETLCDGNFDCPGKEDERYCAECKGASVLCEDNRCGARCDGVPDCGDGRDEAGCPHCSGCGTTTCERLSMDPNVTRPIVDPVTCARLCDGKVQCKSGKDEAGCGSTVFGCHKIKKKCVIRYDSEEQCSSQFCPNVQCRND